MHSGLQYQYHTNETNQNWLLHVEMSEWGVWCEEYECKWPCVWVWEDDWMNETYEYEYEYEYEM